MGTKEEKLILDLHRLEKIFRSGDMSSVVREAKEIISECPSATAYNILALAYKKLGNYELSQKIYETLLKHNPTNVMFLGNLGNVYMDLGLLKKAEHCFRKCLDLDNSNYNVSISLASILQAKSCHAEALQILKHQFENRKFENAASVSDLHYRIAEIYRSMGKNHIDDAIFHYGNSSAFLSEAHKLELIYKYKSKEEYLSEEKRILKKGVATPLLAAVQSHAAVRYEKRDENLFCDNPFDFIFHTKLTEQDGFNQELVNDLLRLNNNLDRAVQPLLSHGSQSAGNFLLNKDPSTILIRNIILKQIRNYRNQYATEKNSYITHWPEKFDLYGWIVDIKTGGNLGAHIHKLGWLSGSIYLKIPSSKATESEGNIVFSLDGANYPQGGKTFPSKELNIETGDIVLFPSSVFHKTLPFTSNENRVTLAFDVKPLA